MKKLFKYSIVLLLTLSIIGCCKENNKIDNIVQNVWEYSLANPDGFTIEIPSITPITRGIAVAYKETQNHHSYNSLYFVVQHSLSHNSIVGGWLNPKNIIYYFDSIRIF